MREGVIMIPDPHKSPVLTIEEVAPLLGIGRSAAYEAARRGQLPTIRLGRRLLVPTMALLRQLGWVPVDENPGSPVEETAPDPQPAVNGPRRLRRP